MVTLADATAEEGMRRPATEPVGLASAGRAHYYRQLRGAVGSGFDRIRELVALVNTRHNFFMILRGNSQLDPSSHIFNSFEKIKK